MITLFRITGSSSFVARAALEVARAQYEVVNVDPRRREEAPGFRDTNPLMRVRRRPASALQSFPRPVSE